MAIDLVLNVPMLGIQLFVNISRFGFFEEWLLFRQIKIVFTVYCLVETLGEIYKLFDGKFTILPKEQKDQQFIRQFEKLCFENLYFEDQKIEDKVFLKKKNKFHLKNTDLTLVQITSKREKLEKQQLKDYTNDLHHFLDMIMDQLKKLDKMEDDDRSALHRAKIVKKVNEEIEHMLFE